jgi:hypothetical protein
MLVVFGRPGDAVGVVLGVYDSLFGLSVNRYQKSSCLRTFYLGYGAI